MEDPSVKNRRKRKKLKANDGRLAVRLENTHKINEAVVTLILRGNLSPSVNQIAKCAGVCYRTVYKRAPRGSVIALIDQASRDPRVSSIIRALGEKAWKALGLRPPPEALMAEATYSEYFVEQYRILALRAARAKRNKRQGRRALRIRNRSIAVPPPAARAPTPAAPVAAE